MQVEFCRFVLFFILFHHRLVATSGFHHIIFHCSIFLLFPRPSFLPNARFHLISSRVAGFVVPPGYHTRSNLPPLDKLHLEVIDYNPQVYYLAFVPFFFRFVFFTHRSLQGRLYIVCMYVCMYVCSLRRIRRKPVPRLRQGLEDEA